MCRTRLPSGSSVSSVTATAVEPSSCPRSSMKIVVASVDGSSSTARTRSRMAVRCAERIV
jgi:hypothetical protein